MPNATAPLSYAAIIAELGFTPADDSDLSTHVANTSNPHSVTKSQVGLGSVENTALSTWAGSTNLTTLGTVSAGIWNGTPIGDSYIASAATWNAKQAALGFTPEDPANKDQNSGYAGLDSSGKINPNQLPALAITDTFVVASQVAMLALTAEVGDIAVRTDLNKSFILKTADATVLANWQELLTPTDSVTSVFGRSGTVTAQSNDYTFAQIGSKPTTLSGYGITDAQGLSTDLSAIAGLTPTNDDILQRKAGAWTNRSIAQLKTDLSLSGTNTGDQTSVTGNAGTATALQTARAINGVSFDGTAAITVTAAAGTLTGTTLNSTVVTSSLTAIGTVTSGGLGSGASLGAVTMSLGSDANGDIYYRASNVLTRLAKGTALQQLRMNAGATAPEWATITSSGATTALDNLASVAINTALVTGAGVAAAFTATAPAAITTSQAGIAASLTASAAVAGSSVAGAANGGSVTITAGAAARNASGNGNGGDINLVPGALIGSGNNGAVIMTDDRQFVAAAKGSSVSLTPSITFKGNLTTGWNGNNANQITTICNGVATMGDVNVEHRYLSSLIVGWTSGAVTSTSLDTAMARSAARMIEINNGTVGSFGDLKLRQLYVDQTITPAGTTGNQTINKAHGTVNIAAAGTTVTVTCDKCTVNSTIYTSLRTNDTTAWVKSAVPGAGSFVITLGAAATAEVSIGFHVVNL